MTDLDDSIQSKVFKTLSQLISNDAIKNYFNSWDEKENNPNIIGIIFNKLILTKFINEYQKISRYKIKICTMRDCIIIKIMKFNV